jgi:hypothetical protein
LRSVLTYAPVVAFVTHTTVQWAGPNPVSLIVAVKLTLPAVCPIVGTMPMAASTTDNKPKPLLRIMDNALIRDFSYETFVKRTITNYGDVIPD